MKKTMMFVLAFALVFVMLSPVFAEGKTISIVGNANDLAKSYMTYIFDAYEAASGNTIDVISMDSDNFDRVATAKFATGDIPDILQHFNDANVNNYDVPNNFLYLNDQPWVEDITQAALDYSTDSEGNLIGLPFWESSVSGCYYNKTILEELGLEPATTQEEFDALCDALLTAGYIPLAWPMNGCPWQYQFAMDPIFADDGGEKLAKLNANEIKYADIPEMQAMAEWVKKAADKGWFGETYLTDGWSDITVLMGTGEAVMTLIWDTWFYTDFDEGYDYTKEDFGLMPVFMGTADEGTFEGGNLNLLMVNKNSENLEEALDFLSFCADPENYNAAFDGISTVSVFKQQTKNIQSAMVTESQEMLDKLLRTSTTNPQVLGFTQAETAKAIQEMVIGNVDPAGCVALMDEYRIASASAQGVPGF